MLYAVTTGKAWFRIGETIRYDLTGDLCPGDVDARARARVVQRQHVAAAADQPQHDAVHAGGQAAYGDEAG